MELQTAKGVRDFLPPQKIARDQIVAKLKTIFERYGYNPLETPTIERYDLFASKYGQGEESEAMQESFVFTDRGDRKLILRNEFTVPLARVVGMNKQLKMPFKRYQMGPVFRDGPLKTGRYREFWQCDADAVGCPAGAIDAELLDMAQTVFDELGLEIELRLNNRKILDSILNEAGIPEDLKKEAIIAIDKTDKVGLEGVMAELKEKKFAKKQTNALASFFQIAGSNEEKLKELKISLKDNEGIQEIENTLNFLMDKKNINFMPSLARGLAYYTGNIFEVFLKDLTKMRSSLAGGGRYDKMIGGFLGGKQEYPAVGISFGLETIADVLEIESKAARQTVVKFYLIPLAKTLLPEALKILKQLRNNGLNADIDYLGRSFSKALEYANAMQIPYALILGEDEIKTKSITVKNMEDGSQKVITITNLIEYLKKL
ncbi:MAG: histidine--tRNA ligase [Parcubacteria group bacterium]|nr:histidine--tRNA ligase [Parcubacteria group bacterium]